jgi:glycosyltransferase involved in cell wall biosynthesis
LKIYYIAEKQLNFLPVKKCKKIHTIINGEFASAKTNDHNPIPTHIVDAGYVLFLGRVCERKGVIDLIEAFCRIKSDIYLVIAGPAEELFLKKIARKYPRLTDKKIVFLEPVYDLDKKISMIDQCLFMIYPSYEDAFPLTVIECFARGKLMLCTNISETKNFVVSNDLLFSPGDIDYLCNFFEFFNSKKNLNNYFGVIEEMKARALKYARGAILIDIFGKG